MPLFGFWSGSAATDTIVKHGNNGTQQPSSPDPTKRKNNTENPSSSSSLSPQQLFQNNTQQLLLLVSRIESSSSLEQRREAADELARAVEKKPAWSGPESITYCFIPNHINSLRHVLQDHADEYDIVASILEILLAATALPGGSMAWTEVAQNDQSSHRSTARNLVEGNGKAHLGNNISSNVSRTTAEQQRAHAVQLVTVLIEETPYLLDLIAKNRPPRTTPITTTTTARMADDPSLSPTVREKVPFWVQYNAMQLLARLHAADHATFGKYLLQCSAVPVLLEILNDASNNGVLRDECLVLLQDITLLPSNHELQTILAFDNCFDALFSVIREEGGMVSGGVVVRECITVMHNIIRSNHAAQRLFREMGSLAQVAGLLNTDVFVFGSAKNGHSAQSPSASPLSSKFGPRDTDAQAQAATMPPAAAETYAAVGALISTLIRSADSNGEGADVRAACVASNLPQALVRAAFESLPVANGSFEAEETQLLGTLALAIQGSRQAVEALILKSAVRQFGTSGVDVAWLLMRMALTDDPQRAALAAQILTTAISVGGADVASKLLLDGLERPRLSGSAPMRCGYMLATLTMASKPPTPTTWHVAGHILANCILASPEAAAKAANISWSGDAAAMAENFFHAYVARTRRIIEARQTDIATNMAVLYPILAWLRVCPAPPEICCFQFTSDPATPMFFADWATACRDASSHVPLMCAAIVAVSALMYPASISSATQAAAVIISNSNSAAKSKMTREQLMQLVTNNISLKKIEALRNSVLHSDDWNRATRAPVLSMLPSVQVYDQTMCGILNEIVGAVLTQPVPQQQQAAEQQRQQIESVPFASSFGRDSDQTQNQIGEFSNSHVEQDRQAGEQHQPVQILPPDHHQKQDPFSSSHDEQEQDPFFVQGTTAGDYLEHVQEIQQQQQQQLHQQQSTATEVDEQHQHSQEQHYCNQTQQLPQHNQHQPHQQQQHYYYTYEKELSESREKLSQAEELIRFLEEALSQSKAREESLALELKHVKESSFEQVQELERQKMELQHQCDRSYQLVQRRNDDVTNAERRVAIAELQLQDVAKDKNELLLLVVEMERQYQLAIAASGSSTTSPSVTASAVASVAVEKKEDDDLEESNQQQRRHRRHQLANGVDGRSRDGDRGNCETGFSAAPAAAQDFVLNHERQQPEQQKLLMLANEPHDDQERSSLEKCQEGDGDFGAQQGNPVEEEVEGTSITATTRKEDTVFETESTFTGPHNNFDPANSNNSNSNNNNNNNNNIDDPFCCARAQDDHQEGNDTEAQQEGMPDQRQYEGIAFSVHEKVVDRNFLAADYDVNGFQQRDSQKAHERRHQHQKQENDAFAAVAGQGGGGDHSAYDPFAASSDVAAADGGNDGPYSFHHHDQHQQQHYGYSDHHHQRPSRTAVSTAEAYDPFLSTSGGNGFGDEDEDEQSIR